MVQGLRILHKEHLLHVYHDEETNKVTSGRARALGIQHDDARKVIRSGIRKCQVKATSGGRQLHVKPSACELSQGQGPKPPPELVPFNIASMLPSEPTALPNQIIGRCHIYLSPREQHQQHPLPLHQTLK